MTRICLTASTKRRRPAGACAAILALITAAASPALAVNPQQWIHATESDFVAGESQNVVVTNLGDVKLAVSTQQIEGLPDEAAVIYDMQAVENGDFYVAAGPEAKLLRRSGDAVAEVLALPGEQVFALATTADGRLLLGISAMAGDEARSRLAVLDADDQLVEVAQLPGVRYIWDIAVDGQTIYLATGTEGHVLRVNLAQRDDDGNPAIDTVLDAAQSNILCLALDGQGRLFAGTDTDGLVYRLTPNDNGQMDVFVVFDAAEPEIGALLVMPDGTVFAGTADARQARPGRLEQAVAAEAGRPAPVSPEPAEPEEAPEMPELPPQVPPEPAPIEQPDQEMQNTDEDQVKRGQEAVDEILGNEEPDSPPAPQDPQQDENASVGELMLRLTEMQAQADAPAAPGDEAARPTREQLDALREVIRQRLQAARQTGELQAGPPVPTGQAARPRPRTTPPSSANQQQPSRAGNAIYRISRDGFVSEIFRESVMILRLIPAGDQLLVATGNEGQLFSVNPATQETTILVDLEQQQITAMLPGPGGDLLLATTKPASLVRLSADFAEEGQYTSAVLDAAQISLWGQMQLTADVPQGSTLSVQTRSGNVQDPEQAAWSPWSDPVKIEHDPAVPALVPRTVQVTAPPARFLQYRLTFTSAGQHTAAADRVGITYVVPNMRPRISSITVADRNQPRQAARGQQAGPQATDPFPDPQPQTTVQWEAADANNDRLVYALEYRMAGATRWLPLEDELEQNRYEWDTRRMPDGWYVLRVTASDEPSNPATMAMTATRNSIPTLVDNTAPLFEEVQHQVNGRVATITGRLVDSHSAIGTLQYAVNATDRWQPALPNDLIFDSTDEPFTITIPDLAPGQHVVTLRARDVQNNAVYRAVVIEVR